MPLRTSQIAHSHNFLTAKNSLFCRFGYGPKWNVSSSFGSKFFSSTQSNCNRRSIVLQRTAKGPRQELAIEHFSSAIILKPASIQHTFDLTHDQVGVFVKPLKNCHSWELYQPMKRRSRYELDLIIRESPVLQGTRVKTERTQTCNRCTTLLWSWLWKKSRTFESRNGSKHLKTYSQLFSSRADGVLNQSFYG